jgi:hypothetical protein
MTRMPSTERNLLVRKLNIWCIEKSPARRLGAMKTPLLVARRKMQARQKVHRFFLSRVTAVIRRNSAGEPMG